MKRIASLLAIGGLLAALAVPASALAYTVPNLTAVTTPDEQVAVTYADNPNLPGAMAQAGAFATQMQSYGFIGVYVRWR